ncbi:hypothetical protein ES711_09755 [Gelidibacter salicanalis]|uniref:Uncharacterized protein n=1 Tax=Gelidibacter salicanalis TaxID=291193 RepID=A0A5C7AG28_9FLAO|nr:hypothetical protein [Gelidibacter salicanalis]TXE07716.1 hypothetical protein ES711_09755 [Gelidibacter salicanalis]
MELMENQEDKKQNNRKDDEKRQPESDATHPNTPNEKEWDPDRDDHTETEKDKLDAIKSIRKKTKSSDK